MTTAEARQALLDYLMPMGWVPARDVFSWARSTLRISPHQVRCDVRALIQEGRVERQFWSAERCAAYPGVKIGQGTWCDLRAVVHDAQFRICRLHDNDCGPVAEVSADVYIGVFGADTGVNPGSLILHVEGRRYDLTPMADKLREQLAKLNAAVKE